MVKVLVETLILGSIAYTSPVASPSIASLVKAILLPTLTMPHRRSGIENSILTGSMLTIVAMLSRSRDEATLTDLSQTDDPIKRCFDNRFIDLRLYHFDIREVGIELCQRLIILSLADRFSF